jgi:preprotein translocase subunit Sec61beta
MRARRIGALLALAVLGLAGAASAQHLTVSAGAGAFAPSDEAYRRIYGTGLVFGADAWLAFGRHFGLAAGFARLSDDGLAVPMGGGEAAYPLSFRRTTVPLLAFCQLGAGAFTFRLGVGAGFHSYRESWDTVDLEFKDIKIGPRVVLAVAAAVLGRLSLTVSATYDSIPTGAGSALATNINLGGFQVQGGLAFRVF